MAEMLLQTKHTIPPIRGKGGAPGNPARGRSPSIVEMTP